MKTLVKLSLVFVVVAAIAIAALFSVNLIASADGPHGHGPAGMGNGMMGNGGYSLITTAAKTLGMTHDELTTALKGGKTIADVAKDKGVALDKIVDDFVATRQDMMKTAVTSGRMTQEQVDSMISQMKTNVLAQLSKPYSPQGFADMDNDGMCDGMMDDHQGGMMGGMMGGMGQHHGSGMGR